MGKKKSKKKKGKKPKRVILKKGHFLEFFQEIRQVAPLVLEILKKKPKTRDSDNLLRIEVEKAQGMKESDSYKKYKYRLVIGKISPAETIRRARQKIQEDDRYKHLRGKYYKQRQLAEVKVKNQLALW